jgi:hypothetical protein
LKNILILADGAIARHFVVWVGRKRVAENRYYVTCFDDRVAPERLGNNVTVIKADPTSFARIKRIMSDVRFSQVFVVMENKDDARYALKNVRLVDEKVLTIFVDQWDDGEIGRDESNVVVLDTAELIAAHLYDHLPNVPLVAQNVGLGKGEIMEILVPFGSTYAYRHVGSILQRKWRIAAIYRNEKLILPTNATMIRPNDTLLAVGKPMVLEGIYRTVNRRIGLFPEPYGRHLYVLLDFKHDKKRLHTYLNEARYIRSKLREAHLYIRVINPNDFTLLDELKALEDETTEVSVDYTGENIVALIEYDIQEYDVGWVLCSHDTFEEKAICTTLRHTRKVVGIFGDTPFEALEKGVVLMDTQEKMESISSTAFDAVSTLDLHMCLCDFDPQGEFEEHTIVVEHYETLAQIFGKPVEVIRKTANPVREAAAMRNVLHILPYEVSLCERSVWDFLRMRFDRFIVGSKRHPKLLVPFAGSENAAEGVSLSTSWLK